MSDDDERYIYICMCILPNDVVLQEGHDGLETNARVDPQEEIVIGVGPDRVLADDCCCLAATMTRRRIVVLVLVLVFVVVVVVMVEMMRHHVQD